MKHLSQDKAKKFESGNVTSWEYETTCTTMNVAHIKVKGRYPEEGFTINLEVDSVVHILGGSGILDTQKGERIELAPHDQVYLAVNDAYFFDGNLELLYSATPKWTAQQAVHIT